MRNISYGDIHTHFVTDETITPREMSNDVKASMIAGFILDKNENLLQILGLHFLVFQQLYHIQYVKKIYHERRRSML